jgi:hypothetical protein
VPRIERIEFARHVAENLVDEGAHAAEGMILWHPLLGGDVAEHRGRLAVVSSHAGIVVPSRRSGDPYDAYFSNFLAARGETSSQPSGGHAVIVHEATG